ncbi:hypothetical protein D9757_008445 [Collybiopsis confluens]|uniref:Uncharacterized protein n=1 Tax=Collybiopsis confluens TaxID=2823264 RepID=A0A8H5HFH9_9AGAR|nr:hypothetical protein D9757_008445 [Collybiopsis confluens]
MTSLRKSSIANLCDQIRQKDCDDMPGFDTLDFIFEQQFGYSPSDLHNPTPFSPFTADPPSTKGLEINVGTDLQPPHAAGSPIYVSSSSDESKEESDDDDSSDSSDSDSDVAFFDCGGTIHAEGNQMDLALDASNRPSAHDDTSNMPRLSIQRERSPLDLAFIPEFSAPPGPFDFMSPFPSPSLPHDVFGPGPTIIPEHEETPSCDPDTLPAIIRSPSPTSDDEDEYEDSGSDGSDDEYAPSSHLALKNRKRGRAAKVSIGSRRILPMKSRKRTRSTSTTASTSTSTSRISTYNSSSPLKRRRIAPESRNEQSISEELQAALEKTAADDCDFVCPVCNWVQGNKRFPDYHRHLKTHARPDPSIKTEGYWCKGARVEDLESFNLRQMKEGDKTISEDARAYWFHDHLRIGGCCQQFSRRDALKRHMMNTNVACAGPIGKGLDEA